MTTQQPVIDGSAIWMLTQCISPGCAGAIISGDLLDMDMTGYPNVTQEVSPKNTLNFYFLHCTPHASIITQEMINDGTKVSASGQAVGLAQTNLMYTQSILMLSLLPSAFSSSALGQAQTPTGTNALNGWGSMVQASLLLGVDQAKNLTSLITETTVNVSASLQSIANITDGYAALLRSMSKRALDGSLGITYVPARTTRPVLLFTSSLPHVIVSTVFMVILGAFGVVAHYRRPIASFTFVNVAVALDGSDVPAVLASDAAGDGMKETDLRRRVLYVREPQLGEEAEGGGPVLALQ